MTLKMQDSEFLGDTIGLLRPIEKYDHHHAYQLIQELLLENLKT